VPDTADYEAFDELLARPASWTERERRMVEFSLREQRDMLARCHPKDLERQARLARIVQTIESALGSS
jgi:hypothetical protein